MSTSPRYVSLQDANRALRNQILELEREAQRLKMRNTWLGIIASALVGVGLAFAFVFMLLMVLDW